MHVFIYLAISKQKGDCQFDSLQRGSTAEIIFGCAYGRPSSPFSYSNLPVFSVLQRIEFSLLMVLYNFVDENIDGWAAKMYPADLCKSAAIMYSYNSAFLIWLCRAMTVQVLPC